MLRACGCAKRTGIESYLMSLCYNGLDQRKVLRCVFLVDTGVLQHNIEQRKRGLDGLSVNIQTIRKRKEHQRKNAKHERREMEKKRQTETNRELHKNAQHGQNKTQTERQRDTERWRDRQRQTGSCTATGVLTLRAACFRGQRPIAC